MPRAVEVDVRGEINELEKDLDRRVDRLRLSGLGWPADPRELSGLRRFAYVSAVVLAPLVLAMGLIVLRAFLS